MSNEYTTEQLAGAYAKLPPVLQEALISAASAKVIRDTAVKYKLHVDQMGMLADETGLVLLGLVRPHEFMPNVAKRLGVTNELASQIASDVDAEIFANVYSHLRKLHDTPAPAPVVVPAGDDRYREPIELNRNQILNEIENPVAGVVAAARPTAAPVEHSLVKDVPTQPPEPAKSIFNEKMVKLFNVPQATVTIPKNPDSPATTPTGDRVDPYREPIS